MRSVVVASLLLIACKPAPPTALLSLDTLKRESGRLCVPDGGLCDAPLECVAQNPPVIDFGRMILVVHRCQLPCTSDRDCPVGSVCLMDHVLFGPKAPHRTCHIGTLEDFTMPIPDGGL